MKHAARTAAVIALSVTGLTRADSPPHDSGPERVPVGVYVAPFRMLDTSDQPFTGEAVRDAVTAALSRQRVAVLSSAGEPPSTDAVASAKAAGAAFVLTGSVQTVDGRLRLTGQVARVDRPQEVVAGLTATGLVGDRLALEDQIANQAGRALPRRSPSPPASSGEPALKAADLLTMLDPSPATARPAYAGSKLQRDLNTNRSPANDFDQQLQTSRTNNTFGSYHNYGYPLYGGFGFGFGGFGYGFGSGFGGFGGFAAPYGNFVVNTGGGLGVGLAR